VTWHGTLIGLFLLLVAGGIGLPCPEDLTLLAAGALAQPSWLRLANVVIAGLAGVITGDWILYGFGRRYGEAILEYPRLRRLLGAHRIKAVRETVMRYQARSVFFARFVFGTRVATFLAAGTFGVSALRFALAEAAGSLIFVPTMATFGYLFAERARTIVRGAGRMEHWLVLAGLLGLALYLALRAWATRASSTPTSGQITGAARTDRQS
jgi:membrane protein DedA with SNARE-associated domain